MNTNNLLKIIPGGERWVTMQELARFGINSALHKFFRYAKIKGNMFIFVFSHPAALQEFKLSEESVKERMRIYYKERIKLMRALNITFARVHAAYLEPKDTKQESPKNLFFREKATGDFVINCREGRLKNLFEEIRKTIKDRHENEKI